MNVVVLFPGQGAQHPGMLALAAEDEVGRDTLAEAAAALDALVPGGIRHLDTPDALAGTVGAQLALLVSGVASGRAIVAVLGPPLAFAGHSVGAFAAAVVAGVLTLEEAVGVVHVRATTMAAMFPAGYGMVAATGLSPLAARRLAEAVSPDGDDLWVANVNSDDQTVFAGRDEALDRLARRAADAGAQSSHRLAVSVPSHGPRFEPVAAILGSQLAPIADRVPVAPCSSNVTGRLLHTATGIREDLARLTACTVQWRDVIAILVESGADVLVQARPGRALATLAARQRPDVSVIAVADTPVRELAASASRRRR